MPSRKHLGGTTLTPEPSIYAPRRLEASDMGPDPDRPEHSLIVYGTLAPGRENHHLLERVTGEWSEVTICGDLGEWEGYPMFRWRVGGERIPAWLLASPDLPAHFDRLDEFETDAYVRLLVPYESANGAGVAYCYVAAAPDALA